MTGDLSRCLRLPHPHLPYRRRRLRPPLGICSSRRALERKVRGSFLSIGRAHVLPQVRLEGPVKGRSGVCRDLDTDLKRMKELGVGCIIWYDILLHNFQSLNSSDSCLDDEELFYLGAPWPEYEERARINGIDVLRFVIGIFFDGGLY